jgi:hypothetical protein
MQLITLATDRTSILPDNRSRWTTIVPGQEEEPAEPEWLVQGLLAPDHLTILWGAKKLGKTTLITWLLKMLEGGTPFLGLPTKRSRAIWLTEVPEVYHRQQAQNFGLASPYDLLTRTAAAGWTWEQSIEEAVYHAQETKAGVLVVDTFSRWACLGEGQENDASIVTRCLDQLQTVATGLAVVVVHHAGHGQSRHARGSSAFGGVGSILLRLQDGREPRDRIITCEGSHYADVTPTRLDYRLDESAIPHRLVLMDRTNKASRNKVPSTRTIASTPPCTTRERIWGVIPNASPGLTAKQLIDEYQYRWGNKLDDSTLNRHLKRLASHLGRNGVPRSGNLRYWRKEESLAA